MLKQFRATVPFYAHIPFDWRRALLPETVSTYDRLLVSVTLEKREGACALFVQKTPDMFTNLPSARKTLLKGWAYNLSRHSAYLLIYFVVILFRRGLIIYFPSPIYSFLSMSPSTGSSYSTCFWNRWWGAPGQPTSSRLEVVRKKTERSTGEVQHVSLKWIHEDRLNEASLKTGLLCGELRSYWVHAASTKPTTALY